MLSFESDYNNGAHPKILEELNSTNFEQLPGYGTDKYCGSEIRAILQKAINNNKVEKYNLIYNVPDKLGEVINCLGKQINNSHFLDMQNVNNKIVLTISLFCEMSLTYMINISDNADKYDKVNYTELIEINRT